MTLEVFRNMTEDLPKDTEIIINFDDTRLEETIEFAKDDIKSCFFEFKDDSGRTVKAVKIVSCCSKFYDL